jgi:cytoskeletal protein CcmA (bactofilin family)
MSLKQYGSGSSPSGSSGKDADNSGAEKSGEHPVGDALERLQSMYPAESETDAGKARYAVKSADGNLIAGAGVKFKGQIAACHTLTVEGKIDVNVRARKIIVADGGAIAGKADVCDAEIAGRFDGDLVVSGKLMIRRTGHISGTVSYGQLEIEPGGELRGRVEVREKKNGGGDGASEKSWAWRS